MPETEDRFMGWSNLSPKLRAALIAAAVFVLLALVFSVVLALAVAGGGGGTHYSTPQFLLASASVALLFWSVIIAVLIFIGWQRIRGIIAEQARERVDEEAEKVERKFEEELEKVETRFEKGAEAVQRQFDEVRGDIRGNVHLTAGVIYGRLAIQKTENTVEIVPERRSYLPLAIGELRQALEKFEDPKSILKTKNNLAFAYALDGSAEYGPLARSFALELREDSVHGADPTFLNTYARVVAAYYRYFDAPREALTDARDALGAMIDNPNVSDGEKQNARRHLTALDRASEKLESERGLEGS